MESNSQHLINRRTASYSQDTLEGGEGNVDLHNKEFCVDVSTYEPVVWQEVDAEQCDTVFVKKCEERSEEVCADVTETRCEVNIFDTTDLNVFQPVRTSLNLFEITFKI